MEKPVSLQRKDDSSAEVNHNVAPLDAAVLCAPEEAMVNHDEEYLSLIHIWHVVLRRLAVGESLRGWLGARCGESLPGAHPLWQLTLVVDGSQAALVVRVHPVSYTHLDVYKRQI